MSLHLLNEHWLEFDGVDDYVQAANSNVFDVTTGDFDMEVEFRSSSALSTPERIIDKRGQGSLGSFPSYQLSVTTNTGSPSWANTVIESADGTNQGAATGGWSDVPYANDGQWHTAKWTWENSTGTTTLYVDGIQIAQGVNANMVGKSISTTRILTIGAANTMGHFFNGDIKSFRFGTETFPINEGTGTTITGSEGTVLDIYGPTWGGGPSKQINEVYIEDSGVLRPVKNIYLGTSTGLKNIYQSQPTP